MENGGKLDWRNWNLIILCRGFMNNLTIQTRIRKISLGPIYFLVLDIITLVSVFRVEVVSVLYTFAESCSTNCIRRWWIVEFKKNYWSLFTQVDHTWIIIHDSSIAHGLPCPDSFDDLVIFREKKHLEQKKINSVAGVFFLLLVLPMTRRLRVAEHNLWRPA